MLSHCPTRTLALSVEAMAVPKAKSCSAGPVDYSTVQDEDFFSTGSSASFSSSDGTGTVPPFFSLGGWFGQSSTQRSHASRGKISVDESSQDEDGTMGDFSTIDNTYLDSSESDGETHLVTASQSVIISLSYSRPDSERSDEESTSRSHRGSSRYSRGSTEQRRRGKVYKDKAFHGRNVMKVTTNIAAYSLGLQDESRDPGDIRNSATEAATRDDRICNIGNTPKSVAPNNNLASSIFSTPKNPANTHRPIASDEPTVCGDTVISTPSKAKAFFEQDDATVERLQVEKLSTPTTNNSWLVFNWFASPAKDDEESQPSAAIEPSTLVAVSKGEPLTTPDVTSHVKVEEGKPNSLVAESGHPEEIEVSPLGPILSESSISKVLTPKVRLGSFRGLFSGKKGKTMAGQSRQEKEDKGCENDKANDDPDPPFVKLTEPTKGNPIEVVDRLVSTNVVPSEGVFEQENDCSPIVPAPINAVKSDSVVKSLSREPTARASANAEKKAMIPLSLPRPRKIGTRPSPSKVATKGSTNPAEPEKLCEQSSKIPASLPKGDTSLKSATTKLSTNRKKKFGRWGRDSPRQIEKTASLGLRTGSDLPTIDEERKDSSLPIGMLVAEKEMTVNDRFATAQQTILLDAAATGETHRMTTNGTIPVQISNSSISFQSGRSGTSKMSKASKKSIASGHSEETIKRRNRGILRRLLLNKSRQDTSPDNGELNDLITQYKEMKSKIGHDGPKAVNFFLDRKNKLMFSSLSEERRALRAMNHKVAQRLREIDEMQQTEKVDDLCGASLCLCG